MTKAELIKFREKLVRAKELSAAGGYECLALPLEDAGLSWTDDAIYLGWGDTWRWYQTVGTSLRIAMWDNSIAHVDKLIAEAK